MPVEFCMEPRERGLFQLTVGLVPGSGLPLDLPRRVRLVERASETSGAARERESVGRGALFHDRDVLSECEAGGLLDLHLVEPCVQIALREAVDLSEQLLELRLVALRRDPVLGLSAVAPPATQRFLAQLDARREREDDQPG